MRRAVIGNTRSDAEASPRMASSDFATAAGSSTWRGLSPFRRAPTGPRPSRAAGPATRSARRSLRREGAVEPTSHRICSRPGFAAPQNAQGVEFRQDTLRQLPGRLSELDHRRRFEARKVGRTKKGKDISSATVLWSDARPSPRRRRSRRRRARNRRPCSTTSPSSRWTGPYCFGRNVGC